MSKLEMIGIAVAAGAVGHVGARGIRRLYWAGTEFLADCLTGWMDDLTDLAPGRLVHGQGKGPEGD